MPSFLQCMFSVQTAAERVDVINYVDKHGMLTAQDGTNFQICQHCRLYYLCKTSASSKHSETLQMWHKLLEHCNTSDVKKLENAA